MKVNYSVQELADFEEAVHLLSDLAYKTAEVRGKLATAGIGTFDTRAEYDFFYRLETRLDSMRNKLSGRLEKIQSKQPAPKDG